MTTKAINVVAKAAAERAAKNAGVAPQLLYAPILWELQAAIASGALVPASVGISAQVSEPFELMALLSTMKSANAKRINMCIWDRDIEAVENAIKLIKSIRQLDTAPASGDCTHANKFTRTKAGNDLTPENYCPDCDTVLPMLHAASRTGGGE